MPGAYSYVCLVVSLLFVPIWALWYWRSPTSRREMLIMSGIFICIGVPSEALLYTRDWWHPATVTGTLIGVDAVLYSLGHGLHGRAVRGDGGRPARPRPPTTVVAAAPGADRRHRQPAV